ncbi:hypothetical protein [uncultured Deinococcus sp.]|uniref:hypothetical protein n=1 Tax=uncultured Deinococcus sp. TaxID=158789 RepID=UPI0025F99FB8|nr:hypothetical protein [uncultured Deinococcus sp.]
MSSSTSSSGLFNTILGWLPRWLGFVLILLAGAACVVSGLLLSPSAGVVAFGVAFIVVATLSWVSGGGATPSIRPGDRSFGASLDHLPMWVWVVNVGLIVVAIAVRLLVS